MNVSELRVIARPRDEVAAYVMDPVHDTEWIGGISRAEKLTDGPVAVGTRVARTAAFMGRSSTTRSRWPSSDRGSGWP